MYAKLVHQLSRIHALLLCFMHDLSASHGTSVHSALRGRSTLLPLRLASPCVCCAHVHVFPWRRAHRATGIGSLRCVGKHCCTYATRGRVCAGDRRSRPLSALHCTACFSGIQLQRRRVRSCVRAAFSFWQPRDASSAAT
jgi:hypothetical protein